MTQNPNDAVAALAQELSVPAAGDSRSLTARDRIRRSESRFDSSTGASLFQRDWLPPNPQRLLVVVHGFAEHSGRYEEFGAWFARRGAAVHAYDQRGHGQSEGRRGHVDRFEDYVDDLQGLLESLQAKYPDLPCTLVGHSMGGLVVALLAGRGESGQSGIVLSGGLLSAPPGGSQLKRWLGHRLRGFMPHLRMDAGLDPAELSSDPAVVARYQADPMVFSKLTVSLGVEMMDAAERVVAAAPGVSVPALVLHGAADTVCSPAGSEAYFAALPTGALPGCALHLLPGLRHEIFNEPTKEAVFQRIQQWLETREPLRGGATVSGERTEGP